VNAVGSASAGAAAVGERSATIVLQGAGVRRGELTVLHPLHLRLPLRGCTVILGPNGAGKSTLLGLMHGLIAPDEGRVLASLDAAPTRRPTLAYLFQRPVMLRRSALANITHALAVAGVPREQRAMRAQAALARVGMSYAAHRPARRLSGGEQQRVALARAQALDPHALLLDEPTASLDPAAAAAIERELQRLCAEGVGLVMATHDLAMARRMATEVLFLHRGRVLEHGPASSVFAQPRDPALRRFLAGEWLE